MAYVTKANAAGAEFKHVSPGLWCARDVPLAREDWFLLLPLLFFLSYLFIVGSGVRVPHVLQAEATSAEFGALAPGM